MGRQSAWPRTARALAAYLAGHPLVWICGLPGGAFAGVVGRIDGDTVEVTAVAGGRKRYIVMPAGWNCRKKKAPVRTRAIRDAFRFHAAGFRVSSAGTRMTSSSFTSTTSTKAARSHDARWPGPRGGRRAAGVQGEARRSP